MVILFESFSSFYLIKKIKTLIASQKSINYIEREEFYVALRLIALAQNNLPYDIEKPFH